MKLARGLPIAAYLGAMVALALAAAFIAVLAIVVWLPPRPPAVMRADEVTAQFTRGYEYAIANRRPMANGAMAWRVQAQPPRAQTVAEMAPVRGRVARGLGLEPAQVRVAAANVVRSDVFVFRVRELDAEVRRHVDEAMSRSAEARRLLDQHRHDIDEAARAIQPISSQLRP
ncbi:MAG: hypothetical protein JNK94_03965 [Hyphomonadaceae bacterium]|nr:hypothetical protein [Hyphomonadaceae bacterium]